MLVYHALYASIMATVQDSIDEVCFLTFYWGLRRSTDFAVKPHKLTVWLGAWVPWTLDAHRFGGRKVYRLHLTPYLQQLISWPVLRWAVYPLSEKLPSHGPHTVILKGLRDAGSFDTEKKVYRRLGPLQGIVVPHCFGEVQYRNDSLEESDEFVESDKGSPRALVLSD